MGTSSVAVDGATIGYTDVGTGPPLVFVHGAYVTGALWDDVVAALSDHYRCIAPTFPFGAQAKPVGSDVDLGVIAAGRRIIDVLEQLDLTDVILVANDTGGGIVLSALGNTDLDWGRVSRLVFTNCDSYEHFPPKGFAPLVRLCRVSAFAGGTALRLLTTSPGRATFAKTVTRDGIGKDRQPAIFGGFLTSADVRRDAVRFTAGLDPRYTTAAATAITSWSKPVLMVWGDSDDLFPLSHAQRLVGEFNNSTLNVIKGSSTYVMLDRPTETAEAIRQFVDKGGER